ncbi:MBL fold metallo-hydrolase [bacterium]|nr:MBL fold metallo-hydrolase [bacterium]
MKIESTKVGEFDLFFLHDGEFWLDAGGYFGVIPKVIWQKLVETDELNRTVLKSNPLLVCNGEHNVLIDPGLGGKYNDRQVKIWKIKNQASVIESLNALGLTPEDIDVVVATHLHFDHVGSCTRWDKDGKAVPVFPNAIHYIQKAEWEDATHPDERTKGTYFPENYLPLQENALIKLIEGNKEILPGISVEVTGGHTRAHQIIFIRSGGQTAVYFGGIVSSVNHVKLAYTMAFDQYPVEIMQQRKKLYKRAIAEDWMVILEHDPNHRAIRIKQSERDFEFDTIKF